MPNPLVTQAIITRYHGPGNVRGARISATSASGVKVTIPYPHECNSDDAHRRAADALIAKLGWGEDRYVQGALKDGYAFVALHE